MPLIEIKKAVPEPEYVYTHFEKHILKKGTLPPEQIKATNHDEKLLEGLVDKEVNDADSEKTLKDIYDALRVARDVDILPRVLQASKNLSIDEKNKIVQGIYNHILNKTAFVKCKCGKSVAPGLEKCPACEKPVIRLCRKCHEPIPFPRPKFCSNCRCMTDDLTQEDARRLDILLKNPRIDLFDLCVQLSQK